MIGKKINQLATELAPASTDLTIIGNPTTGVSKKITLAQLGAIFSGAVSFYTNYAAFPTPGTTDVIYCAKDTQKLYLWSGSAYVEVFPSQALLDTYQLRSEKGNANGYASLDSTGKVPVSQLPSSIMEYKGTWSAATNTPTLANGTGDTGDVYICNAAGSVNFGAGAITFAVGDYVIYSGSIWQRSSGAVGTVTSVAASITGNAIGISGSPVTTSGTLAFAFAGTSAQYVNGAGNLVTFPSIISQAQNIVSEVYNNTGATLTKGTIVYINGGQGNLPTVTKALATGDSTSAQTYGIVQADITNMNNGYVVIAGRLIDLDTQAYSNGTQLYLSGTTAGTWTSTKPYAPIHLVYVGIVVRSHPTQGVVEVKIQNGYELDEIHNVAAQTPTNNDGLFWEASTSLWKNKSISTILGGTPITGSGSTNYIPKFTASGTIGNSNLYDNGTNIYNNNPSAGQFAWQINGNTTTGLSYGAVIVAGTNASDIALRIQNASSTSELFFVYGDGKVKINNIPNATTDTDTFLVSDGGFIKYRTGTQLLSDIGGQAALTNPVTGTGTTNYLPKFTGSTTIGNSLIQDNGTNVSINVGIFSGALLYLKGIGATTATYGLYVANSASTTTFYVNDAGNGYFASGIGIGTGPSSTYGLDVNGATRITGNLTATSFIKSGGTSSQYLMADGSVSTLTNPITGTGTTNYLPKFTGTSTIGNSIVSESGSDINVAGSLTAINGIYKPIDNAVDTIRIYRGNTSPYLNESAIIDAQGGMTHIRNKANDSVRSIRFSFSTDGSTTYSEAMRLNASGNLSIGNTNNTYKLDVTGTGRFQATASSYAGGSLILTSSAGTNPIYLTSNGGYFALSNGGGADHFLLASTGAATFSSSVTASSFAVGASANYNAMFYTAGANASYIQMANGSTGAGSGNGIIIGVDASGNGIVGVRGAFDYITSVAGVERMRITSGGSVGIGTTSPSYAKLVVDASNQSYTIAAVGNDQTSARIRIKNTGTGGGDFAWIAGENNVGNSGLTLLDITNNATRFKIKSDGIINLSNVPSSSAGLSSGDIYKTVAGVLMIV